MQNHKRRIAEFYLPEEIIQRIQSFLDGREAAQTTLLSKSWRSAWSTRPNLDFDQHHFGGAKQFSKLATKTIKRYRLLKLKIHSLRLHCYEKRFRANKLLAKAMNLGAFDLDITVGQPKRSDLRDEVLLSQTLTTLCLSGGITVDLVRLTCSNLKSLRLINVYVKQNDVYVKGKCYLFRELLPRLPLLERLELKGIRFSGENYGFDTRLKLKLDSDQCHHKLEYLDLQDSRLDSNLIILSSFPSLKELVIRTCLGLKNIRISSQSLERISIQRFFFSPGEDSNKWETELCVPNIRNFKLEGYGWSRLILQTTCTEWESDIVVDYVFDATPESFISLNKALNELSLSRVSLSLMPNFPNDGCSGLVAAAGLPTPLPAVERLMLAGENVASAAFLDNLFLICRPKLIARRWFVPIPSDAMESNKSLPIPTDDPRFKNLLARISERVVVEEVTMEGSDDLPLFGVVCFHLGYPADITSPLSVSTA